PLPCGSLAVHGPGVDFSDAIHRTTASVCPTTPWLGATSRISMTTVRHFVEDKWVKRPRTQRMAKAHAASRLTHRQARLLGAEFAGREGLPPTLQARLA